MRRRQRTLRRVFVLATALAACTALFAVVQYKRAAAREAHIADARMQGIEAYQQGRYVDALPHFGFYATHDRRDVEVLMAFADARAKVPLENNRHLYEAAVLYGIVVDLQPDHVQANLQLMYLHERLQRRLEWREAANRVLDLDPGNVSALRAKATAAYLSSRFDEAGAICSRLIALEPEEITWRVFYLQIMQDRGDDLAKILQMCNTWMSTHKSDGRYHLLKARLLSAVGRHDEARQSALAATQRGADVPLVLEHLVVLLDALSLQDEASDLIESTKQRYPREQWAYEASVRRYWKAGDYERAIAEIEHVSAEHDRLGGGLLRWENLLKAFSANPQHALTLSTSDVPDLNLPEPERDAALAWARAASARAHLESANVRDALNAYREALALRPDDPVLHYLMGEAYARAGEYHLAARSLEHAVRSDPGWISAQRLYAQTLLRLERHGAAADLAAWLLRRSSRPDLETCLVLARAWYGGHMTSEEIGLHVADSHLPASLVAFLELLHEQAPGHAEVVELLALAYLREGQTDRASGLIERTIAGSNLTNDHIVRLSQISENHNLQLEAKIVQAGIERVGADSDLAMLRARLLHRLGQSEAALSLMEQSPSNSLQELKARAGYLAWSGQAEAADALHAVLDRAGDDIEAITFVLSQTATWTDAALAGRAIDMLERILGRDAPRVALAKAGYALQFQSADSAAIAQAMLLTNRVLARSPDSLNALRLMTMLYLAADPPDVEAAIRQLSRAIQAHPRRVDLYPTVIRLLQRQGDHRTADIYLAQMGRLVGKDQSLLHAELLLLEAQGDLGSIVARLSSAEGVFDSIAQQLALAATWHRAGESAKALGLLDQLLAANPESAAVYSLTAQVMADVGRTDEGFELLRAFERRVESGVSAMLLGVYAKRVERHDEAAQWLGTALDREPARLEVRHHLANHHLARGHYNDARTVADAGLNQDPDHIGLLTTYATASIHLGGSERRQALRLLDMLDCRAEAVAATLHMYDRVVSASGQYSSYLLVDLRDLVQRYPEYAGAWRLAITTHAQAGQTQDAIRLARYATTRLPSTAEFAQMGTQLLISRNQLGEALEMARVWRERTLHHPLPADTVIAALQLDLQQARGAANQLSSHVDRIVRERQQTPQRFALLMHAYAADRRFDQLSRIAIPVLHEDERWPALLLDLAGKAEEQDAATLQQMAQATANTAAPQSADDVDKSQSMSQPN